MSVVEFTYIHVERACPFPTVTNGLKGRSVLRSRQSTNQIPNMEHSIMPVFVSLLRGINVGGNKRIKMADLKALYESLGLTSVHTLLQSGNVVFASDDDAPTITTHIQAAIRESYGFDVDVLVIPAERFKAIAAENPFGNDDSIDGSQLLITFLEPAPSDAAVAVLLDGHTGTEVMRYAEGTLFIHYPDGMGRSKLDNKRIERALKVTGTGRNRKTVNKILALVDDVMS